VDVAAAMAVVAAAAGIAVVLMEVTLDEVVDVAVAVAV